jgi:hypothetical protein
VAAPAAPGAAAPTATDVAGSPRGDVDMPQVRGRMQRHGSSKDVGMHWLRTPARRT